MADSKKTQDSILSNNRSAQLIALEFKRGQLIEIIMANQVKLVEVVNKVMDEQSHGHSFPETVDRAQELSSIQHQYYEELSNLLENSDITKCKVLRQPWKQGVPRDYKGNILSLADADILAAGAIAPEIMQIAVPSHDEIYRRIFCINSLLGELIHCDHCCRQGRLKRTRSQPKTQRDVNEQPQSEALSHVEYELSKLVERIYRDNGITDMATSNNEKSLKDNEKESHNGERKLQDWEKLVNEGKQEESKRRRSTSNCQLQ